MTLKQIKTASVSEFYKAAAKKYNAQIRKEIKILQGVLTENGNRNEWLKKQLTKN